MIDPATLLLAVTGTLAIAGAFGTVLAKNPLRAAVSLLVHVSALAGVYLTLHAELLAVIQMLVYAGAIVVLFVFVIMLIGPGAETKTPNTRVLGSLLSVVFMMVIAVQVAAAVGAIDGTMPSLPEGYGTVEGVGNAVYRGAGLPFELLSILLLVAIVAAVAVARGRTKTEAAEVRAHKAEREADVERRIARAAESPSVAAGESS